MFFLWYIILYFQMYGSFGHTLPRNIIKLFHADFMENNATWEQYFNQKMVQRHKAKEKRRGQAAKSWSIRSNISGGRCSSTSSHCSRKPETRSFQRHQGICSGICSCFGGSPVCTSGRSHGSEAGAAQHCDVFSHEWHKCKWHLNTHSCCCNM